MRLMLRAAEGRRSARFGVTLSAMALLMTGCGNERVADDGPAPDVIPFVSARVTDNPGGTSTVRWSAPGVATVRIYAEGRGEPVAEGGPRGTATVRGVAAHGRRWFRLVPDRGRALWLADRSLGLASVPNFRDAGGYRTADGRWVAMGKVYRSAGLERISAADRRTLRELGIGSVYDLRTVDEARAQPDALRGADPRPRLLDVLGPGRSIANTPPASAHHARTLMRDSYGDFVAKKTGRRAYRTLFTAVAGADKAVLYHCTAGKDRTGWASAALLTALGVPHGTVVRDYLASNPALAGYNRQAREHLPDAREAAYEPMLGVRENYLHAAFGRVSDDYGSFDRYLKGGLRLADRQLVALRDALLVGEPAS
ncbi:tyrosine-protein phosphatase [Streptomyces albus]|uniref:tyrosine-protein phosphatase n=1 Tax=Streptomyces albus TaxID=1888 RepID=UPI0013B49D17|nr:tyrosine-protein phosphatase [Streptomyces albus]QID38187.1 tyrosine-protein phosphatase [Streptomyces albus]